MADRVGGESLWIEGEDDGRNDSAADFKLSTGDRLARAGGLVGHQPSVCHTRRYFPDPRLPGHGTRLFPQLLLEPSQPGIPTAVARARQTVSPGSADVSSATAVQRSLQ